MVNWEDADLRDALLVGFWNTFKEHFSQETKDQIMAAAQKHDSTINWNNFRQHIAKLQKKEGNGAGTPAKSTPAKSTPGKKTPASGKRKASAKKAAAVSTDEVKDDDEEMETPSKKVKTKEEVDDVDIKQPSALDMEVGDVDNDYEV